jgi:hypothetical protein
LWLKFSFSCSLHRHHCYCLIRWVYGRRKNKVKLMYRLFYS